MRRIKNRRIRKKDTDSILRFKRAKGKGWFMKNWMVIIVSGLLVCFIARLWRDRQGYAVSGFHLPIGPMFSALRSLFKKRPNQRDDRLTRLEEVLQSAELTNNSFF